MVDFLGENAIALNERSKQIRRETIILSKANGGYHYGGSFSAVEILISLYDKVLTSNDRFILSKGHACWPYYVLLRERGYDPKLEGHPTLDPKNGVHCSSGSEGHGLPVGIGMAMAKKRKGEEGNIYVLMGDGECQEGTTWESLLIAAHYKLDNLTVIVDYNKIQGSGLVDDILPIQGIDRIAKILGWLVSEINGHSCDEIETVIKVKSYEKPRFIIAYTVKGKGVSFMENEPKWHAQWPDAEHEKQAFKELI
uniref:Putative transketolase domain containing protein n=1 Tax=viral metagenome TaxID=1070528 RepID=A0A6M3M5U3_9ZZZZ